MLMLVGSHVELTAQQLDVALQHPQVVAVELDVHALLDEATGERRAIDDTATEVIRQLEHHDVCLQTTREVLSAPTAAESLALSRRIAVGLADVAHRVLSMSSVRALVAKGGITSHDAITRVLEVRRGWIVGQMFEGLVPVLVADSQVGWQQPCVVFPGNVGEAHSLATILSQLREGGGAHLAHSAPASSPI